MYDLILCVLATTKNNRLPTFSKIGYKKSSKYKTKIVYLIDDETKPDGIDGDWYNCFSHFYSTRFIEYLKNSKDESRWFLQVDDDSCTDIDKTIELLDYSYDYEDPMLLTGSSTYFLRLPKYINQEEVIKNCFCYHLGPEMQQVLKEMDAQNLPENFSYYKHVPNISCGWEQSVFSKGGVNKLRKYDRFQEYLFICIKNKPNFGDQVPFVLAKIAKIPIAQCFFLSALPNIEEYTGLNKNGRFTHIHHICEPWDQLENFIELIEKNITFNSSEEIVSYFDEKINNTDWFFFHILNNKIQSRCVIKLQAENKIKILENKINCLISYCEVPEFSLNHNHEVYNFEDKRWSSDLEKIEIINDQEQKIIFNKLNNKLYGCKYNENEFFILSKINIADTIYWSQKKFLGVDFSRIEI